MAKDAIPRPPTPEEIEQEKDKMDLRPALQFIEQHLDAFESGRDQLLAKIPSNYAIDWAKNLKFVDEEKIAGPQIRPYWAREVLMRMPGSLIALSKLKEITYEYGGDVIEPIFNPDGTIKTGNTVPIGDWGKKSEHPTRILIGSTPFNGEKIYQSALPDTVYENKKAAELYQTHVLIHEFFHTVEQPLMAPGEKSRVMLATADTQFTLQDWWNKFEEIFLQSGEGFVSRYASGRGKDLNATTKRVDPAKFDRALAEQICESFVAYQMGIISNDDNWTSFKKAMPLTWKHMDLLCNTGLLEKDDKIEI